MISMTVMEVDNFARSDDWRNEIKKILDGWKQKIIT